MTLRIMTLSIMTLSIMTLIIMTLSIMTLSIMTLSIMTLIIMTDDFIMALHTLMLNVIYAECRFVLLSVVAPVGHSTQSPKVENIKRKC
jgi:hypothetical protein